MGNAHPCDPRIEECPPFDPLGAVVQLQTGKKLQLVKIQRPRDFTEHINILKSQLKRCKPCRRKKLKKRLKKMQQNHMVYIVTPVKKR